MYLQDSNEWLIACCRQLDRRHLSCWGAIALFIGMLVPAPSPAQDGSSTPKSLASKSPLPHQIEDDNYLEALTRFHAAVPRWLALGSSYHRHTDVRIVDIYGKESNATVDRWQKGKLIRDEETAPGWHYIVVWGVEQNWSTHEGISPLRLFNLSDLTPRPGPAERRIRIFADGYVAMRSRNVDGVFRSCSGEYAGAEVCFDSSTGFPTSATVDDERIVYEQWEQFNGAAYPSRVALYRGRRLQMEATTRVTPLDQVDDSDRQLFHPLPGVAPTSNRFGADRSDNYKILAQGNIEAASYGDALVKVYVDESGRVRKAVLIDADDKDLGSAAMNAAKRTAYMPVETDGHRVPFETSIWTSHWSTVDPIRVPATSVISQGTD